MAFSKRERKHKEPVSGPFLGRLVGGVLRFFLRLTFGIAIVVVVASGLIYLRLSQGPIHLPFVAQIATQVFNSDSERLEVALEDMVLTIGEAGDPAGVQFVNFQVKDADGAPLFAVPRLSAKFYIPDLLRGQLRPTRIVLIRPEARLLRTREGNFRFGLGTQLADIDADIGGDALVGETPQLAAISRILDGLVGDAEPTPELSRLTEIIIYRADLTYENAAIGRRWRTRRANLRISRAATGLTARLSVGLADGPEAGAGVVVTAERRRGGGGATRVNIRFDDLRPEHLAEQIDQMQWLRLFDAPLGGNLGATIHADGRIEGLTGRITAGPGRILGLQKQGQPFDSVELAFAYEAGLERMQVSELSLASKALDTRLSGFVDLARGADGAVIGLAGQFEILGMQVAVPKAFAEPLSFDGGQIVARLDFEPMRIEVGEANLRTGDLIFEVSGNAWVAESGWHTDLRAGARNLTIAQLIEHWPLVAVKNVRAWIEKNVHNGTIDELVAQMRFGAGDPQLNLDFAYSGVESSYLGEMTPVREARGSGSVTLKKAYLKIDAGEVEPVEGAPVHLDGSTFRVSDIQNWPWPSEAIVRATGLTSSILTLIDQQPLGLMKKLGMDPADIQGNGEVVARVNFPLVKALKLDEVEVEADAQLSALRMPFKLPSGQVLDVAGNSIALSANKQELNLSGGVRIDDVPMALGWSEHYGRGSNNRSITLQGAVTPVFLRRFGLDTEYFADGQAGMTLSLEQEGSPDYAFDLTADLTPARLEVAEFSWVKTPGRAGRLEAVGHYGDGIRVSRFGLDTEDLKMSGAVEFGREGGVQNAQLERVRFRGMTDVAVGVKRLGDGSEGFALAVSGKRLDLAVFDDPSGYSAGGLSRPGAEPVIPLAANFDLAELVVTPRVVARPATGTYRRDAADDAAAELAGRLAGKVPFTAEYERNGGEAGSVVVRADDAGAMLKAAQLFGGAEGGRLKLKARINPEAGIDFVGVARIKDVRISGASTFKSILDEGGVKEAASAAEGGGLAFDKVEVPFEYREGVLILGDTTAKGTLLAVKVEGTVDENSNEVDLIGVISPAYALTGALDSIPLLGDILSGGKGEGILAMTFKVKGSLDQPEFSVNPLSLLAPGILRNIFSGRAKRPDEKFIENLKREID
jgi:hypothetical protein